jgi:hypothetical protein
MAEGAEVRRISRPHPEPDADQQGTNASISSKAPSKYLGKLKADVKGKTLTTVLKSHYLSEPALSTDDHSKFVDERLKAGRARDVGSARGRARGLVISPPARRAIALREKHKRRDRTTGLDAGRARTGTRPAR